MSNTITVQNSINFATPILKNQPLLVSNLEPAMSAANLVLGTVLGAPFRWRFNRGSFNFPVTAAGVDYPQVIKDLGFLETIWIVDGSNTVNQLTGAISLAKDGSTGRPSKIALQYDDNSGNITARLDRTPDQNYTVFYDYQRKAPVLSSPAIGWGVVPDEFSYIYNWGFLCVMSLLINDSRFPVFENYFIARLLGAQDGLSDQERNIFLANWMGFSQTLQRNQGAVNSGVAGRGK